MTTPHDLPPVKRLVIEHNHGHLTLTDVQFETYEYDARKSGGSHFFGHIASGTVESGGVTNRLFHATSHTPYPKGELMTYDIYGRRLISTDADKDEWRVSCVSCG